jgi:hypothetical protein
MDMPLFHKYFRSPFLVRIQKLSRMYRNITTKLLTILFYENSIIKLKIEYDNGLSSVLDNIVYTKISIAKNYCICCLKVVDI